MRSQVNVKNLFLLDYYFLLSKRLWDPVALQLSLFSISIECIEPFPLYSICPVQCTCVIGKERLSFDICNAPTIKIVNAHFAFEMF